jgi:hypothetical protein
VVALHRRWALADALPLLWETSHRVSSTRAKSLISIVLAALGPINGGRKVGTKGDLRTKYKNAASLSAGGDCYRSVSLIRRKLTPTSGATALRRPSRQNPSAL